MEAAVDIIRGAAGSLYTVGIITAAVGGLVSVWMNKRSFASTARGEATRLDALYLACSVPGFSRFSALNQPDGNGNGIYAALALEQIGAIDDMKPFVEVSFQLYPNWPATYLSAARYAALNGEGQKARDYLSVAKTLSADQKSTFDIPQLSVPAIERLIESQAEPAAATTSIASIFTAEIRKKPFQLIAARSTQLLMIGIVMFLGGLLLYTVAGALMVKASS